MIKQILEFYLSDHFMQKGWDRSIDEYLLYTVLPFVEVSEVDKKFIIITPAFLGKRKNSKKPQQCLILVLKHKLITTGYWCDHPNYLFKKEKEAGFQLLYN